MAWLALCLYYVELFYSVDLWVERWWRDQS